MATGDMNAELYRTMRYIREFEEAGARMVRAGELQGNLHLSLGQEAVATGVCAALRPDDFITTTHRGHGHCIAKGGDLERMFAELMGKADGYCRGKAGSMHIADPASGILGATAIVGGGYAMAAGAALSAQVRGTDQVGVAFFGEGAVAEGLFHEALNLAALWRLPVVFVCENNQFAELTHVSGHIAAPIHRLAEPHGIPGVHVDGNDVTAVRRATVTAVDRARSGAGPTLIEALTYRISGHWVGDPMPYRDEEEAEAWAAKDPLLRFREAWTDELDALDLIDKTVRAEIDDAAERARAGAPASPESLMQDVYATSAAGEI